MLIDFKKFEDTDVQMVAVVDGGILCKQYAIFIVEISRSNGLECVVKDYVLDSPPPLGSLFTVKHNGVHPNGLLNCPTFWRQTDFPTTNPTVCDV